MMNGKEKKEFDVIVVGSGITGGWAAKELCEQGLKTLMIERGRNIEHVKDYPTAHHNPWDFKYGGLLPREEVHENPIKSTVANAENAHFFVNDDEQPYTSDNNFKWIRGYQLGGRSLVWGRACYRWSNLDFEANLRDGVGVDWPIRYEDIAPWYSYVEKFVGISGRKEGLPHLPDGEFLPDLGLNAAEKHFRNRLLKAYKYRILTPSRMANLTQAVDGRGPCQFRNACDRGCPYSGYFCSITSTLPAAKASKNLTVLTDAVVTEVLYDANTNRAKGVRAIDAKTGEAFDYGAKMVFLNAGSINSTAILLNSARDSVPNGLGNSSGELGHNLMDHFIYAGAEGELDGYEDRYYKGRSPGSIHIPRFRNINKFTEHSDFIRGYAFHGFGARKGWKDLDLKKGAGVDFKEKLLKPGRWKMRINGMGETLPYHDNRISLHKDKKDKYGMPIIDLQFSFGSNEKRMREDVKMSAEEMLDVCGFKEVKAFDYGLPGGQAIHEMGTARMGRDPKTSVLNKYNQLHDVPNVFVTDGACMTSSGTQNPSITYMALTARACHYAVEQLKKNKL